ncbi:putative 39S ribosomal protein L45, mitochondrial [Apostichopus japonicus]|uniref:Large ribosomal subunit protein mL45 n=1 Tax=Stichopus japonicus TaxID=307972 RepID=A0A2G8L5S1_STIJA|nr:putative 39S ribosomal protein L45, mitochondrial [Apostichopus japonicus]
MLLPSSTSLYEVSRPRTTQKIHKARKKARLLKKDQKRLAEKEEWKKDPRKMVFGLLRKAGMKPGRQYAERAITITCTGDFFEPYIPPEGDGKASTLSKEGAKQRIDRVKNIGVTQMAVRKIRQFQPEFQTSEFAWKAQQIFIDAHNNLQNFDKNTLHSLVTEKCYPEMVSGFRYRTIRWNFIESLEKPRVVHVRCTDMMTKGNVYAQVTVRMLSRQTLAIYDRFGRLEVGSEDTPKDVLEYIVLEKHLPSRYGAWRLHGKIVPHGLPTENPS